MNNSCYDRVGCQSDMMVWRSKINMKQGEWKESYIKLSLMLCMIPLYPSCVFSIMAQSRNGLGLHVSSACLLWVCGEARSERVRSVEEEEEAAWDRTRSLHTQLKESCAQRHSLATCVLTFVFLSVVLYRSTELKAKLAAAQLQRLHCTIGVHGCLVFICVSSSAFAHLWWCRIS